MFEKFYPDSYVESAYVIAVSYTHLHWRQADCYSSEGTGTSGSLLQRQRAGA